MRILHKLNEEEIEKKYYEKDKRKKRRMKVSGASVKKLPAIIARRGQK